MKLLRAGVHFYLVGLIILTLGISLAVLSALGTSPYDALLVGLFRTFGLTIGSWEIITGFIIVFGNALAERKRPQYFALVTSFVTGVGIDGWLFLLKFGNFADSLTGQWICLVLAILFTGLGIAIYIQSEVAPNPVDHTMLIVSNATGWSVTYSRATISVVLVITAFFFDGAIGIGTLFNAVLVGMLINLFLPHVKKIREFSLQKLQLDRKYAEGE
ncbi:YczE/YyaS/YitT family protein [Pseudogracilibacillus sp. SO30301A]|uniref:YczE/YyaS/YitT family protein n=1 Tax=Pseudogracilibacillus sp. SO30301A TaxID=3098291 RepID=UPI00300E15C3